jgi:Golgi SNAP receptor complex protein 1
MATSFELLKREAVQLERQLEEKVSRYQQLAQRLNQSAVSQDLSMTEQGASASLSWDEETILQQDIQRLLTHLQDLIQGRLAQAARSPNQQAVVGRYRDIMMDLRSDLEKSQQTVRRAAERRELLQGSSATSVQSGSDPAMDHLLRERNHIQNSMTAATGVLGQAEAARTDLRYQGRSLRNTQGLIGQMTSNIPGLNTLVENIRRRRSRDDIIVAGVISACVVFTLWYMFG